MRDFLFLCIFSLFALFSAHNSALAFTNGDLYEKCKPFADRAFKPTVDSARGDFTCSTYFRAAADFGWQFCESYGKLINDGEFSGETRSALSIARSLSGLSFVGEAEMKAAIQDYVNEMAKNPEQWKYNPSFDVQTSFKKISPCE